MINKQLINLSSPASSGGEEGLILHLDANDVDSYDGDGSEWVDITDHEYTPTTNVSEHFNTVLYNGNDGDKTVTGVGFAPDLVWIKNYWFGAFNHLLRDTVRGNDSVIQPNTTIAETTATGTFEFLNDGFRLPIASSGANNSNYDYVAWCFNAGGVEKTNTEGTVDSTVRANNDLGFSIVKYIGNGSSTGATIGHGLDTPPEMIIVKDLDGTSDWAVYSSVTGNTKKLLLNSSNAAATSGVWNNTSPTSSVFTVRYSETNEVNHDFIAYSFTSKRGVSKVGSYVGTGTTNKIYTGFEPAFVMVKRSSTAGAGWYIVDNKRDTNTNKNKYLSADSDAQEASSGSSITFNRDGFTFDGSSYNTSSETHIYYAVAKNTNEASLIPDTDLELHLDAASFPEYGEAGYFPAPFTWIDSSVNGNNGTINFAMFNSELGNWLEFDGIGTEVNWSTFPTAFESLTAITMELWVKFDTVSGTQYPIWLGRAASGKSVNIGLVGGKIQTWVGVNGYPSLFTPVANKWYHLAVTISGSTQAVYVDGEDYTNNSSTSGISMDSNASNVFLLGDYSGGTADFNGQIGQVRIYSSAQTQDQIRQNYNFTKPSYPNGYDGTISGATWNAGGYFDFDGSNNYITLPFNTTFSEFSFHAWVNPDSTIGDYHTILGKWWDGSNRSFFLTGLNQILKVDLAYSDSNTDNIFGSTALPDATWSFVCVTWKNYEGLTLTVNDTTETFSINKAIRSNTNSWYIGNQDSRIIKQWDGKISQCKMYDKKLSPTEITAAYNATKSAYGL